MLLISPLEISVMQPPQKPTFTPPDGTVLLRVSRETTFLTEPLYADKSGVDYPLALELQYAPKNPLDNGFREIVKHLDTKFYTDLTQKVECRTRLCEKLRLDPDEPPTISLPDFDKPWENGMYENEPFFELFEKSLRMPSFYTGYSCNTKENSGGFWLPDIMHNFDILRKFAARSMIRCNTGNYCGAWNDVITCLLFAKSSMCPVTSIAFLAGAAFELFASTSVLSFLKSAKYSAEQLRSYIEQVQSLSKTDLKIKAVLQSERFYALNKLFLYSCFGAKPKLMNPETPSSTPEFDEFIAKEKDKLEIISRFGIDWNIVAKIYNNSFDEEDAWLIEKDESFYPNNEPTHITIARVELFFANIFQTKELATVDEWANLSVPTRSQLLGKRMLELDRPEFYAYTLCKARNETYRALVLLAMELYLYRTEHGSFPNELDLLIESGYRETLPLDRFSPNSDAYKYRVESDGTFLLYSVGPCGIDFGGCGPDDDDGHREFIPDNIAVRG